MTRRSWWVTAFLAVTALALSAELLAGFDHSDTTVPWTYLIRDHIPAPITATAIGVLAIWLPIHFWHAYRRAPATREVAMAQPLPVPPSVHADATNRAWRSFAQGVLVDIIAGVVLAVGPALASQEFAFTREYWTIIGTLAAKSAVLAAVSYVARRAVPPRF